MAKYFLSHLLRLLTVQCVLAWIVYFLKADMNIWTVVVVALAVNVGYLIRAYEVR